MKDGLKTVTYAEGKGFLSPIDEIIEDLRNGRMVILVDAEDRENEGDLVIPAQMATPDAINFMAKHGRGLVCLSVTAQRAAQLRLEYMARQNEARNRTAFTVSIDDYVITSLVAGIDSQTLPMTIYAMARRGVSPELNAVSTIVVVALGAFVLLSERLRTR